ncbi:hypothetical protein GCM10023191_051100 [Actinoallomurus oryzae]|uniref:Uncharacterized protein n=1 Tax=Actinoallomurus oryzae TaxID=502180 RepID=A0ABP8QDE0_9ACTN
MPPAASSSAPAPSEALIAAENPPMLTTPEATPPRLGGLASRARSKASIDAALPTALMRTRITANATGRCPPGQVTAVTQTAARAAATETISRPRRWGRRPATQPRAGATTSGAAAVSVSVRRAGPASMPSPLTR